MRFGHALEFLPGARIEMDAAPNAHRNNVAGLDLNLTPHWFILNIKQEQNVVSIRKNNIRLTNQTYYPTRLINLTNIQWLL